MVVRWNFVCGRESKGGVPPRVCFGRSDEREERRESERREAPLRTRSGGATHAQKQLVSLLAPSLSFLTPTMAGTLARQGQARAGVAGVSARCVRGWTAAAV